MKKFNKRAIILGTLALVLGLGLFGCGKKPASVVNSDVNRNQDVNVNTNVVTTTDEIDTSNLSVEDDQQIYNNIILGISFKFGMFDTYHKQKNRVYLKDNTIKICTSNNDLCEKIVIYNIGNEAPINYISTNFIKDISDKCRVEQRIVGDSYSIKYPDNYLIFSITSLLPGQTLGDLIYCGEFGNLTIMGYFLYNQNVPNKLVWVQFNNDDNFLTKPKEFLESIRIF
jgi:hypothetical protein